MSDSLKLNNAKKKKIPKKKKSKGEASEDFESESSEEELDLTKDCHPISYYVNDRAEMINQMFSVIKGKKLKAMLPPILKDYDLEKLKLQCLDQLLGMSEKRIQCILEGENLDTSSESDIPSDDSEDSMSSSDSNSSDDHADHASPGSPKRKHAKRKSDSENEGKGGKVSRSAEESQAPDTGKTLLEILELEMRARAIRALLKQGSDNTSEAIESVSSNLLESLEVTGDIVDLTADDDEFPRVVKIEPVSTEQEQTFQEKVEKIAVKSKNDEDEKKKKLIAETELRNRLKKKKTYRTRQQRMANEEEDERPREETTEGQVEVKTEKPKGPEEVLIEDPEEGEVTSEEEPEPPPVVVKKEKQDSPEPDTPIEKVMDGERITAMDDGNFIANADVQFEEGHDDGDVRVLEEEPEEKVVEEIDVCDEDGSEKVSKEDYSEDKDVSQDSNVQGNEDEGGETSWRERWLNKEDVQKVVKSSKMCGKVKKRIASRKKISKTNPDGEALQSCTELPAAIVEGSVTEYEQLSKNGEKDMLLADSEKVGDDAAWPVLEEKSCDSPLAGAES